MGKTADSDVLKRVAAGEPDSVKLCFDRFGGLVWSLARKFCETPTDAEDAVQEIFTEIWSKADRYDPKIASETTFITMIARRRLIDILRKRGRTPRHAALEDVQVQAQPQTSPVETQEQLQRVKDVIGTLKPKQQAALRMAIYDNCTHATIARELDIPLGSVKTNIRRGLQRIRDVLGENDDPD